MTGNLYVGLATRPSPAIDMSAHYGYGVNGHHRSMMVIDVVISLETQSRLVLDQKS